MSAVTVRAIYRQGVLELLEPLQLAEGIPVLITVQPDFTLEETPQAVGEPWGAFPQLDLSYETIQALTRDSWQSSTEKLSESL